MLTLRRVLPGMLAFLATMATASAQTMGASDTSNGPSLIAVWGWILVAGILIMIVGTSLGVRGRR